MEPYWLIVLATISLSLAVICSLIILIDILFGHCQAM
ncbi:hypothetical protein BH10CHL1_BH10CHL1_50640 [soil metagenome]